MRIVGYKIPGSIRQLSTKLREKTQKSRDGTTETNKVFLWFMVNEANNNIKLYNKLVAQVGLKTFKVPKIINIALSFGKEFDKEGVEKWIEYIKTTCKYG